MFVVMSQTVSMAREEPNPNSRQEIGKRLKLLREALGKKTQMQMAQMAGLTTASAWTNYEKGIRRIELDNALMLQQRTGAPIAWIYHGDMRGLPYDLAENVHALMVVAGHKSGRKPKAS